MTKWGVPQYKLWKSCLLSKDKHEKESWSPDSQCNTCLLMLDWSLLCGENREGALGRKAKGAKFSNNNEHGLANIFLVTQRYQILNSPNRVCPQLPFSRVWSVSLGDDWGFKRNIRIICLDSTCQQENLIKMGNNLFPWVLALFRRNFLKWKTLATSPHFSRALIYRPR